MDQEPTDLMGLEDLMGEECMEIACTEEECMVGLEVSMEEGCMVGECIIVVLEVE